MFTVTPWRVKPRLKCFVQSPLCCKTIHRFIFFFPLKMYFVTGVQKMLLQTTQAAVTASPGALAVCAVSRYLQSWSCSCNSQGQQKVQLIKLFVDCQIQLNIMFLSLCSWIEGIIEISIGKKLKVVWFHLHTELLIYF